MLTYDTSIAFNTHPLRIFLKEGFYLIIQIPRDITLKAKDVLDNLKENTSYILIPSGNSQDGTHLYAIEIANNLRQINWEVSYGQEIMPAVSMGFQSNITGITGYTITITGLSGILPDNDKTSIINTVKNRIPLMGQIMAPIITQLTKEPPDWLKKARSGYGFIAVLNNFLNAYACLRGFDPRVKLFIHDKKRNVAYHCELLTPFKIETDINLKSSYNFTFTLFIYGSASEKIKIHKKWYEEHSSLVNIVTSAVATVQNAINTVMGGIDNIKSLVEEGTRLQHILSIIKRK